MHIYCEGAQGQRVSSAAVYEFPRLKGGRVEGLKHFQRFGSFQSGGEGTTGEHTEHVNSFSKSRLGFREAIHDTSAYADSIIS